MCLASIMASSRGSVVRSSAIKMRLAHDNRVSRELIPRVRPGSERLTVG
jgi:hypothetical protein